MVARYDGCMTTTQITASEVQVGDTIRFSACKPHTITSVEPYVCAGWDNALAFHAGTWSICVSASATVRKITN